MLTYRSYFWQKAPFLKLLLATIAGILFQWYYPAAITYWWYLVIFSFTGLFFFFFIPVFDRYRLTFVSGILVSFLFAAIGGLLTSKKFIINDRHWIGHFYKETDAVVVTLDEPPSEKAKTIKARATVRYLIRNNILTPVKGKIILYFKKEGRQQPGYGDQIIFTKILQEIKNAGNPGGFDYKRYSLFQGITHQVFLEEDEFKLLKEKKENRFRKYLLSARQNILTILRNAIPSTKEMGLAEALLIGYKDDLDQSLVQSYTNTGVVHIIAISGLHLGLIYWLLTILLKPLQKRKRFKWLVPVLIITCLWAFSLLAGAQPSILRSALMFTCIVLGDTLARKTSIYNTIAISAFIILCIDPFWLWDVGFQLSYAAVLSIIIFMRPVYNWFYSSNKILDFIWKMNAVTLAAQVLTIPLGIYYFHQFPNLFILTNFLAVPLSSIILLGEIFLCAVSFIPVLATYTGNLISWLISLMNRYIERIETIPFSIWNGLQISSWQAIFLFLFAIGFTYWLMEKCTPALKWSLLALTGFVALRSYSFMQASKQHKIIVYNIPGKRAIDFISKRKYYYTGDSDLLKNDFARNFHLKPSRILHRVNAVQELECLAVTGNYIDYFGRHILILDETVTFSSLSIKPSVDLLVISKNPKIYIKNLAASLQIKQVVFDSSVPAWKLKYWKKDCEALHIPCYDVTVKGAFVMNLP